MRRYLKRLMVAITSYNLYPLLSTGATHFFDVRLTCVISHLFCFYFQYAVILAILLCLQVAAGISAVVFKDKVGTFIHNSILCPSLITSAKEVMFLPGFVCGFVSLFVNKITQKLVDGF